MLWALILVNLNLNNTRNTYELHKTDTFPGLPAEPWRGDVWRGRAFFYFYFFLSTAFFFLDTEMNMCFKREKCEVFRLERNGPGRRGQRVECAART